MGWEEWDGMGGIVGMTWDAMRWDGKGRDEMKWERNSI